MNLGYVVQRVLLAVLVIVGASFVVFLVLEFVPGDPARIVLGVTASDEAVEALRERMGLDDPWYDRYGEWLWGALQGDFGTSLNTQQPIGPQLVNRLTATLQLAGAGLVIAGLIAFPLGLISATRPGSKLDIGASVFSQIGISVPDFWMGIMLVILFSLTLGWLPPNGYTDISESFQGWLAHLVLPAVTAGLISAAILTRFVRSAMLEVLHMDYVRTARAKGVRESTVVLRHALRTAMISIVTVAGLQLTALLSAVVVIEIVFNWPGLGRLALNAVLDRDYPMLQAAVVTMATLVALINLIVDLLYFVLDPRIEYT